MDRTKLLSDVLALFLSPAFDAAELRKPLRVTWAGEAGIDYGGLRKEFFQLISQQLLDPERGLFEAMSTNVLWFRKRSFTGVADSVFQEYEMIGKVCVKGS